jgi:hypothetical protein
MWNCVWLGARGLAALTIVLLAPISVVAQDNIAGEKFIIERALTVQAQDLRDGPPFTAISQKLGVSFQPSFELGGGLTMSKLAKGPEFLAPETMLITVQRQGKPSTILNLLINRKAACIPLAEIAKHPNCGTAVDFIGPKLPGAPTSSKPDGLACPKSATRTTEARLHSRDMTCVVTVVILAE